MSCGRWMLIGGRVNNFVWGCFILWGIRCFGCRCMGGRFRNGGCGVQVGGWVWCGGRLSGFDCFCCGGRWGGGDGASGYFVAFEQIFESGAGWGGVADTAFEWIQDCEPYSAGADFSGRAGVDVQGIWVESLCGGGRRSGEDASVDGEGDGGLRERDPRDSEEGTERAEGFDAGAAAVADDYFAAAEGWDLPEAV